MALKVPEGPNPKTIKYSDLLGCDFSQDASLIDRRHSPNMLNMISDEGGSPVKRKGWEVLDEITTDRKWFRNIWSFEMNNTEYVVVEVNETDENGIFITEKYYHLKNGEMIEIDSELGDISPSHCAFYYKTATLEGLFILGTSMNIITVENGSLIIKSVSPYVPKIYISKRPTTGGGTALEDRNLLTARVTDSFLTKLEGTYDDSQATTYKLSLPVHSDVKYEYLNSSGTWVEGTASYTYDSNSVTVSPAAGAPPVAGQDNVRITYKQILTGGSSDIVNCRNYALYSQGSMEHIFLTGNISKKQKVWWSEIGDPTYFPERNYLYLGADGGECMGFLPVGNELAVIKNEQHNSQSNIYLIYSKEISSTTVNTDGGTKTTQEYTYAVKRIASANGAVSHSGFAVLGDEPLFLSSQGLFGIVSTNTTEDRVIRNRSRFVDKKLLKEPNLEDAKMITHNDYLYIFVNTHAYVFDGRHKTGDERNNTNYLYEAYYWDNIQADSQFYGVCKSENQLYFINSYQLCRFKNTGRLDDYSDGSHWDSTEGKQVGGVPIHAIWSTRNDDDNAPQMFKTMMKKGTMCTLAPFDRSSVYVYVIADGRKRFEIGRYYADKMGLFEEVDFDRFTFNTSEGPRDYFFRKKRKKYVRLQIFFENNEIDEGFGLYHVIKTYTEIRYAK